MAIFEIETPDGVFEVDAPDEQSALDALQPQQAPEQAPVQSQTAPQHFAFDGANVPGYNPQTGEVAGRTSRLGSFLGGVLEGVPLLGPHIKGGAENIAASLGARSTGKPKEEVLSDIRGNVAMDESAHPAMNIAGGVTGAVAGLAPLLAAAPEVFGASATGGLLARSVLGGASGAMLGAADTKQRGGDALGGAAMGGGLGLLGPAAGQALGAGTRALVNRIMPGASKAETAFGRALGADGVDDVGQRLAAMGPDAMPMDLGPNAQRQAGALASTPGRGQEIVRGAVRGRNEGANQRIRTALDTDLGRAPIPSRVDSGLRGAQKRLSPAYEAAFAGAAPVDTAAIRNSLTQMRANTLGPQRSAIDDVLRNLDEAGDNPRLLHAVRESIDGMMSSETNSKVRFSLSEVRKSIDAKLAAKVPGIKDADAKFANLARQREAVERGQTVLDSGRTSPRPVELADEIARGGPVIQGRLAQGARAEIERIVGTNANDRVALQRIIKGEGDWNRQKLALLFGRDRADRIINVLDRELAFAETSDVVTRNSETAARQAAQKDVTLPDRPAGAMKSAANLQFGDAASKAFDRITNAFRGAGQEAANTELSQLLTSRDPQMVEGVIRRTLQARARGDLSAQRANQIVQSLRVGGAQEGQKRRPLEITVGRPRQ